MSKQKTGMPPNGSEDFKEKLALVVTDFASEWDTNISPLIGISYVAVIFTAALETLQILHERNDLHKPNNLN